MHSHLTKQRFPSSQTLRETPRIWYAAAKMAGIRGKSGPPGNQNAFRHGLAGIAQRRADGVLNPAEQSIREEILAGLLADKRWRTADQHGHASPGRDHLKRCLAVGYIQSRNRQRHSE